MTGNHVDTDRDVTYMLCTYQACILNESCTPGLLPMPLDIGYFVVYYV